MIYADIEHKILTSQGEEYLKIMLDIKAGECVGILGASGCGKSSLLNMIAGVLKPDSGEIKLNDICVYSSSKRINIPIQERKVGIMFQEYGLFPNMNVYENISFSQSKKDKDILLINNLIDSLELSEFVNQKITRLSGGQKQRVALARTLAMASSVMLLDEPLSALNKKMREKVSQIILEKHKEFRSTTIIVSHNEQELISIADRIFYLGE